MDAEVWNIKFAADEDTGAEQTTQTYQQSTQGAEERDAEERDAARDDDAVHLPFSECKSPALELFGRVYSDFGRWLDKDGKVLAFPRPPPPCQLCSLEEF